MGLVFDAPPDGPGRQLCEGLLERHVLAKETHGSTIRSIPLLVCSVFYIDMLVDAIGLVVANAS